MILLGAVQIPRGDGDPDEDKHKAPTSTPPFPLSLQDGGVLLFPDAVVKIHQVGLEQKLVQPGVPGQWFQIAIALKETGTLVGDCALKIDEHDERQAEIGYTLARAYQRKGIAAEAVSCVLDFAFKMLELHRVIAITDCENTASVALLERLGMRREGHFIQNVWFKGKWADEYQYAILQDEWLGKYGMSV